MNFRKVLVWWAVTLALALSACADAGNETPAGTNPVPASGATAVPVETTVAATETPAATVTTAASVTPTEEAPVPGVSFKNPVINYNFPDPFILPVEGVFYAYATNGSGRNVQLAISEDLINWEMKTDAMPALASWVALGNSNVWAPEVLQVGDQFLLYYTARSKEADRQCIGLAVSDSPGGKFRDTSDEPLVCQVQQGGSIDASPFRDGETLYLLWKNDGNCCGRTTWLYSQEMTPDGMGFVGEPVQLAENNNPWEGPVVEAPTMIRHEDRYYLFYSGNAYSGVEYAVGYAVCETPLGPCEDAEENPILESYLKKPPVIGPGHQHILQLDDDYWIFYHAWEVTRQGVKTDRRFVWLDRLEWEDGKPVVRGPTTGVQPVPEINQ